MSYLVTERPPAKSKYELVVYTRRQSEVYELAPGAVLAIGRGAENVVRIDDASVSRSHARLYVGDEVDAEDLGSANGTTLVRNQPSAAQVPPADDDTTSAGQGAGRLPSNTRVRLHPGDVLRIGAVLLVLQPRGQAASSESLAGTGGVPVLVDAEMRRAYELVRRAAATDISVLLLGETGAGKEVMAETVHRYSPRAQKPFLKLNCAALPDSLLESELFGHERGAFTGAHAAKTGLLESTDQGTVFLDEIGELPSGTQAKLLRVLEDRAVTRLGSTKPKKIDVRFVTATNRDLPQRVRAGLFRGDLYYRISGLAVRIPPLRQRPSEIEPLARHFLRAFCARVEQHEPMLTQGALAVLKTHAWPGNVRELRNVMERAVLLAHDGAILSDHVILDEPASMSQTADLLEPEFDADTAVFDPSLMRGEDEKGRIVRALEACGGNQTRAAKLLGVSRRTLINRLEQFDLPRPKKS
jgi:transcriptional regulator with GAF, ATPase, and Fis domain